MKKEKSANDLGNSFKENLQNQIGTDWIYESETNDYITYKSYNRTDMASKFNGMDATETNHIAVLTVEKGTNRLVDFHESADCSYIDANNNNVNANIYFNASLCNIDKAQPIIIPEDAVNTQLSN